MGRCRGIDIYEKSWEQLTREKAFEGYMPEQVCISLNPKGEKAYRPVVGQGEYVCRGQVIGEAASGEGACVHASISGYVEEVFQNPLRPGVMEDYVRIRKAAGKGRERYPFVADFGQESIHQAIYQTGLNPERFQKAEVFIVNGFSNEPYITSGYRLMMESPGKIVLGAILGAIAAEAAEIYVCINEDAFEAAARIRRSIQKYGRNMGNQRPIQVWTMKHRYPNGNESILLKQLLGREKHRGRVVSLSETAALYDGVYDGEPWTRVGITVSGEVASPKNLWVPIGSNIQDIIDYCGGKTKEAVVIHGGPLSGVSVDGSGTWVNRETCGLLVLKRPEMSVFPCIHCGQCRENCPQQLLPDQIEAIYLSGKEIPEELRAEACIRCGLCSYVCPSGRRLTEYIGQAKKGKRGPGSAGKKLRGNGGRYIHLASGSYLAKKLRPLETISQSAPHIHQRGTIHDVMKQNILAILPLMAGALYRNPANGLHLILMFLVGGLTAGLAEYFWQFFRREYFTLRDYSAVFTGLFLTMLFPIETPLWKIFLAACSAILLGKQFFGGFGHSLIHPVIVGKLLFSPLEIPLVESLWPLALWALLWVWMRRMTPVRYGLVFAVILCLVYPVNLLSASMFLTAAFLIWSYETMPSSKIGRWIFTGGSAVLTLICQWAGLGPASLFLAVGCMDLTIPLMAIPFRKIE